MKRLGELARHVLRVVGVAVGFETVLVADDDPVVAAVLAAAFEARGAMVAITANGREAVVAATERSPSLLVLDAQMPELDGYGACRAVRALYPSLPIAIISANFGHWAERERAFAVGANACIAKPFNPATVVQQIVTALEGPRARGAVSSAGAAGASPRPGVSSMLKAVEPALRILRATFVSRLEATASSLAGWNGCVEADVDATSEVQEILHKLAGTCGSLGYSELSANAHLLLRSVSKAGLASSRDGIEAYCADLRTTVREHTRAQ